MIKCVVWDLDGTVWNGTLNETHGLAVNPEAAALIQEAERHGIFQSVASRNAEVAALRQLEIFGLRPFFLFPQIEPYLAKPKALREIAAHFNIGLDALAFVDNDPFERYEARRFVPEVNVFDIGETEDLRRLIGNLPLSGERAAWMRRREARLQAEAAFTGTRADFLRECKMELTVRRAAAADIPRIRELAGRTRQINTAYGQETDWDGILTQENAALYVCELSDIFGDHGLVGAALFRRAKELNLDVFCVSCQVEGRGVAAAFLNAALRREGQVRAPGPAPPVRGQKGDTPPPMPAVVCRCANTREGFAPLLLKSFGFRVTAEEIYFAEPPISGRLHYNDNITVWRLTPPYTLAEIPWMTTIIY
jgi:methoxymalonate biosynthesis protein